MSVTLLAVLLGVLGFWSRRIYSIHKQQERVYSSFLEESRTYNLLRNIFEEALAPAEDKGALFALTFDRGVYKEPEFAGEVRAALHYDSEQNRLEMRIYNLKDKDKRESLLLLSRVKHVVITSMGDICDHGLPSKVSMTIIREPLGQKERSLNYLFALGK